jgi:tetratricopeptide (TPR) repeat protein
MLGSVVVAFVVLCSSHLRLYGQVQGGLSETPHVERRESIPLSSGQPDPQLDLAKSLVAKGELDAADRAARQYLDQHPNSPDGHFLLGYILFRAGKPQDSLPEYTEGAKYRDPSASDLKVVALDYVLLGDYADADSWLTRSVERDPKDPQGWYYLGRTKYNENRLEEAIHAFERCLEREPRNVKAEDNLGLSYEGLGRTEEALTAYRNAIAWQAKVLNQDPAPFIELGRLLLEQDRPEEAISYLSKAGEIGPQDFRAHEYLGKAYSRLNKLQEAQNELERAVTLAPERASLHFMLGQVYRKRGMVEKAKLELGRGAALNEAKPPLKPSPLE